MKQALIIGACDALGKDVEDRLWEAGFRTLIHAVDEANARIVIRRCRPSLVVFLPDGVRTFSAGDLCEIGRLTDAPVLVATVDPALRQRRCANTPSAIEPRSAVANRWRATIEAERRQDRAERDACAREQADRVQRALRSSAGFLRA